MAAWTASCAVRAAIPARLADLAAIGAIAGIAIAPPSAPAHPPGSAARLPTGFRSRRNARNRPNPARPSPTRHTCDRRPSPTTRMCRARTRSRAVPAIRSPCSISPTSCFTPCFTAMPVVPSAARSGLIHPGNSRQMLSISSLSSPHWKSWLPNVTAHGTPRSASGWTSCSMVARTNSRACSNAAA